MSTSDAMGRFCDGITDAIEDLRTFECETAAVWRDASHGRITWEDAGTYFRDRADGSDIGPTFGMLLDDLADACYANHDGTVTE